MRHPSRLIVFVPLILAAEVHAGPAEASAIQRTWDLALKKWSLETQSATTPEARTAALADRPDTASYAHKLWDQIGPSLTQDWTLESAAWFLRATPGMLSSNPDGTTRPTFGHETELIRDTVESRHIKSPKMIPMCMALVATPDPRSLAILEKVQAQNPDKKIQGVAALGAALIYKTLGDEPSIMRKRLSCLREAIINSSDVDLGGATVAKVAEDELYIIRFLTKGRIAPDLSGSDSGGRQMKLSEQHGKVVLLMFWNSAMQEADRVFEITRTLERKLQGKPFVVLGVNNDPVEKLRSLEADSTVTWRNFSDVPGTLAGEYRVGARPLVYVLDGERKIHYSGAPGSFAEATIDALFAAPAGGSK